MKPKHILKVVLGVSLISLGSAVAADDVDSILKQISGESSGGGNSNGQNTTLKKSGSSESRGVAKSQKSEGSGVTIEVPKQNLLLFQPEEKVVTKPGYEIGFYGRFVVSCVTNDHQIWLKPAGSTAAFSRSFIVPNMPVTTNNGLSTQSPLREFIINVSKKSPLIVTSRGLGSYYVSTSDDFRRALIQVVRTSY
jgi:hypothetical protein